MDQDRNPGPRCAADWLAGYREAASRWHRQCSRRAELDCESLEGTLDEVIAENIYDFADMLALASVMEILRCTEAASMTMSVARDGTHLWPSLGDDEMDAALRLPLSDALPIFAAAASGLSAKAHWRAWYEASEAVWPRIDRRVSVALWERASADGALAHVVTIADSLRGDLPLTEWAQTPDGHTLLGMRIGMMLRTLHWEVAELLSAEPTGTVVVRHVGEARRLLAQSHLTQSSVRAASIA